MLFAILQFVNTDISLYNKNKDLIQKSVDYRHETSAYY